LLIGVAKEVVGACSIARVARIKEAEAIVCLEKVADTGRTVTVGGTCVYAIGGRLSATTQYEKSHDNQHTEEKQMLFSVPRILTPRKRAWWKIL
jgi:hypothetical protein